MGRPAQVYDDKGELVWQVEFDIYGRIREDLFNNKQFIPFRQLGQYEDKELDGLYYNRFRYYNSETGMYISKDPIGLAENNSNFYAYVYDSNTMVDVFGLSECSNFKFNMVENPGPLPKIRGNPASNFAGGKYNKITLENDLILYRAGKSGGGKNALGQWFTRNPAKSVAEVRIDLAVKPQWKDASGALTGTSPIESIYKIKIPKGATIYEGPVGYQGGVYLGGQNINQIFIQESWNIKGVEILKELSV